MARLLRFAPCAAALLAACGEAPTEIVLVIDTDVPEQLGCVRVEAAELAPIDVPVGTDGRFPLVMTFVSRGDARELSVRVRAVDRACPTGGRAFEENATLLIAQEAVAAFVPGARQLLFVDLSSACAAVACEAEESCRYGACTHAERLPCAWPGYPPRWEERLCLAGAADASVDAAPDDTGAPATDANADGGGDAALDAGTPDAGPPPTGEIEYRTGAVCPVPACARTPASGLYVYRGMCLDEATLETLAIAITGCSDADVLSLRDGTISGYEEFVSPTLHRRSVDVRFTLDVKLGLACHAGCDRAAMMALSSGSGVVSAACTASTDGLTCDCALGLALMRAYDGTVTRGPPDTYPDGLVMDYCPNAAGLDVRLSGAFVTATAVLSRWPP